MRVETRYIFDVVFNSEPDRTFAVNALRAAAREWASCSNESEPLLHIADELERQ